MRLISFADFECPYCAAFARDTFPILNTEYISRGAVQFVFRHLPLKNHRRAERAAQAAECAGQQQRFWQMHDALFDHQSDLSDVAIAQYADATGIERQAFETCMVHAPSAQIGEDLRAAEALKIRSTPMFLIGRRQKDGLMTVEAVVDGARSIDDFRKVLEPIVQGAPKPTSQTGG